MRTLNMSASGGKADIPDIPYQCPLMTQSAHPTLSALFPPLRGGSVQKWDHQPAAHGRRDARQDREAERCFLVIGLFSDLEQPSTEGFRCRPSEVGERHDSCEHG